MSAYNSGMYIVAIGWLYVTALMSLAETSLVGGVLTFLFYGLAPTALLLWLFGGPVRRRRSAADGNGEPNGIARNPAPEKPRDEHAGR